MEKSRGAATSTRPMPWTSSVHSIAAAQKPVWQNTSITGSPARDLLILYLDVCCMIAENRGSIWQHPGGRCPLQLLICTRHSGLVECLEIVPGYDDKPRLTSVANRLEEVLGKSQICLTLCPRPGTRPPITWASHIAVRQEEEGASRGGFVPLAIWHIALAWPSGRMVPR